MRPSLSDHLAPNNGMILEYRNGEMWKGLWPAGIQDITNIISQDNWFLSSHLMLDAWEY